MILRLSVKNSSKLGFPAGEDDVALCGLKSAFDTALGGLDPFLEEDVDSALWDLTDTDERGVRLE
jgi:hypothetical protein